MVDAWILHTNVYAFKNIVIWQAYITNSLLRCIYEGIWDMDHSYPSAVLSCQKLHKSDAILKVSRPLQVSLRHWCSLSLAAWAVRLYHSIKHLADMLVSTGQTTFSWAIYNYVFVVTMNCWWILISTNDWVADCSLVNNKKSKSQWQKLHDFFSH